MKKILILEDEKDIAESYAKKLRAHGYDVVVTLTAEQALEKLKTMKPDLILLDLGLPGMSGVEFYQQICDADIKPKYPVLLLTGRADLGNLLKDFHIEGLIIKPFESQQLLSEIDIILEKHSPTERVDNRKRIIVVDDDTRASKDILDVFFKAGYKMEAADNGVQGIEKIMANPPHIALVNLNLSDVPGDLVILRLQQMAKTRDVTYLLYVRNYEHHHMVMERLSQKTGIKVMCEYVDPKDLLEVVVKELARKEKEEID